MSTPNVALLKQTLAHIEANPQEWDQRWFRCQTGMCFAGWAVTLAGGKWVAGPDDRDLPDFLEPEPADPPAAVYEDVVFASDRAQRVLGLTPDESLRLFYEDNSLDDLRRIVADLCGGES